MQTHQAERDALARLLASGVFSRSSNLEKMVVYLCSKHFEGQAGLIKEYHVATEALGRSEEFDPKKDSIVRVEMHRLRKRLREYYEAHPDEPIRILMPEKSYAPDFRSTVAAAPVVEDAVPVARVTPKASGAPARWLPAAVFLAVAVAAASAYWILLPSRSTPAPNAPAAPEPAVGLSAEPEPAAVIRIMAGHAPAGYKDRYGQKWMGDRYFSGGTAAAVTAEVATRGFDPNVFANMRKGVFRYDIPLKPGSYELMLLFAETEYGERNPLGGGETSRNFSVTANGKPLLQNFEALSETSDANTATARLFRDLGPAADGKLHIEFVNGTNGQPFLNGLVLSPGTAGRLRPIRIVCRPEAYRDSRGNVWEPDRFHRAGSQITRPQGAPWPEGEVFRGERYGNFSYVIPAPPGKYGARLYFWEYWWGAAQPGKGGVGSRVFDVFCNHKPLLVDFDILKQNAKEQVAVHTFHDLTPNAQGKLVFDFASKANYAMVNAIEIFDESN